MGRKINKKNNTGHPIISVVTVVYNDAKHLEKTIQSVINQTYENIEYIIIDGGSTDGTLDIIKKYKNFIARWISEKDNGVYDAMNKGFFLSSGKWINFLNSGDVYANKKIIERIPFDDHKKNVIIYGDSKIFNKKRKFLKVLKAFNMNRLNLLLFGTRVACHQAIFYNKKIKFTYPKKYLLKGELFSYFEYIKHGSAIHLNLIVCNYYLGGLGSTQILLNNKEQWQVLKDQVGIFRFLFFPKYIYSIITFVLAR